MTSLKVVEKNSRIVLALSEFLIVIYAGMSCDNNYTVPNFIFYKQSLKTFCLLQFLVPELCNHCIQTL